MKIRNKPWQVPILCLLLFSSSCYALETVTTNKVKGAKEELVYSILQLALSKTAPHVQYKQLENEMSRNALVQDIEAAEVDILWAGASPDLDQRLKAIHIPVLKGLLGHRLFIIREGEQAQFDQINNLEQLKTLQAGQGKTWGDTKVLQGANLPTVTTFKYANLFPMLEGGRFDYFPRAVHEPWSEVASRPELNLTIEQHLMLVYPFAMYFYVHPNNQELHDLISAGFEIAIADGSFDQLFFGNPMIQDVLNKAHLGARKVIRIDNPNMSADTPLDREEFWLDVTKL